MNTMKKPIRFHERVAVAEWVGNKGEKIFAKLYI
jgi:hypothetical protein